MSMLMTSAKFGFYRFTRLACLLTFSLVKKCACRLSYTPVRIQRNLASCDRISLSFLAK